MEIDKKSLKMDASTKATSIFNKIKQHILEYKFSALLFIWFFIIVIFQQQTNHIILLSLVSSLSLYFLIFLISRIKFKWIRYTFTLPLAILITFDFICAAIYNSRATENILGSIFETSTGEAIGMLSEIIVPLLIITSITFILTFGAVAEYRKTKYSILKSFIVYSLFFIIFSICGILSDAHERSETEKAESYFSFENQLWHFTKYPVYATTQLYSKRMSIVYSDILGAIYYWRERGHYKDYLQQKRQLKERMTLNKDIQNEVEKVFCIIGESASSNNMSLYGYKVKTTPNMDKLYADSTSSTKLYYHPAITSSLLTRDAVPQMLTTRDLHTDHNDLMKYKNLIELANDVDYETLWISNQKMLGPYDGYIPIIATSATHTVHNIQTQEGKHTHYDDNELIPLIERYYEKNKKQVFFIHLEGSHRAFEMRYDEIDKQAIAKDSKSVDYDRTIHHTDRFLQNIVNLMPANSVLFYISDHGENPESISGRFDSEMRINPHYIPFIVISKNTKKDINKIIQSYISEDFKYINNSNVYYIISELLGYNVQQD